MSILLFAGSLSLLKHLLDSADTADNSSMVLEGPEFKKKKTKPLGKTLLLPTVMHSE